MTLTTFSPLLLLAGLAALAVVLFLLQRLRVRHRDLEVVTTLFWREAVEERHVWVFRRRFRHLWAYLLLLSVAALLWLLVAGPSAPSHGRRHVILLDGSAAMSRDGRFELAGAAADRLARRLPEERREVRLVAGSVETVLGPGEASPLLAARLRDRAPAAAPGGFEAALRDIVVGASEDAPVDVYLLGDAPVRDETIASLPETVRVERPPLDGPLSPNHGIVALGAADAAGGGWQTVDVALEIAPADTQVPAGAVAVTLDDAPLDLPLERRGPGRFVVRDVPARGGVLTVRLADPELAGSVPLDDVASISMPRRPLISVWVAPETPDALRSVLALDPAVRLAPSRDTAEVVVAADASADLRLVVEETADAFTITIDSDDPPPGDIGESLVDDLALRQIDASSLAQQAGREIRLTIEDGDRRRIAMWSALLAPPYDFRDSRALPVFAARAVRWLARRPALLPWAAADEMLAGRGPVAERPLRAGPVALADGRTVQVALLEREPGAAAVTGGAPAEPRERRGLDLFGLIGLLALALVLLEWALYQRGRIP